MMLRVQQSFDEWVFNYDDEEDDDDDDDMILMVGEPNEEEGLSALVQKTAPFVAAVERVEQRQQQRHQEEEKEDILMTAQGEEKIEEEEEEESPFLADMERIQQQQQREKKKQLRTRKRRRRRRQKSNKALSKTPKKTRRAAMGDSSDSDEAVERLERRTRPKPPKKRKTSSSGSKKTSGKKSSAKKKHPRAVPGILPNRDDGYAGFGPKLVSIDEEGAAAYQLQRDRALDGKGQIESECTTTTAASLPSPTPTPPPPPVLPSSEKIVQTVDFERVTGTIDGVPIRMPGKTILAHFARNRRESLEKARQRVAEGLVDNIDTELSGPPGSGGGGVKKEEEDNDERARKSAGHSAKKKKPKTVLDTPLDEYQAFYLQGRSLHSKLRDALIAKGEGIQHQQPPNYAIRNSIAKDLIADQDFRDKTYREPMAEIAAELYFDKRKQEGDEILDPTATAVISSLKLQSLGPGCTLKYCQQFLREPLWNERACVNADLCMGKVLPLMCPEITSNTKTDACIVLREFFPPDEMSEYNRTGRWPDEEHRRCCLLCSRFRTTKAFFSYHARGVPPEDCWIHVAQVQDHWNIVGEGEGYTADEMLPVLNPKTGNWELSPYPMVMLNPSNLRASTMEIQPHQGRMVATIEGTKQRVEMAVPADHPIHSQYYYNDDDDDDGGHGHGTGGSSSTAHGGLKKHIVGCFVEKGQDFR